jgi:hypothetical protein
MDLSSFKRIFQKLAFFGDYSSLIIPAFLVILAALLFIPTTLLQRSLAGRINSESVSKGNEIRSLGVVPSGRQWIAQKNRQISIQNDANKIMQLAEQSSQRELLSYDVFPTPSESSRQIFGKFDQQYQAAINAWASGLRARGCPTQAELSKSLNRPVVGTDASFGSGLQETDRIIVDQLCKEVAQSANVYFDPANIPGYKFWEEYQYQEKERAVEECWYWQLGYWIVEDVFQTVKTLNAHSVNVLDAPVKRIMDIGFTSASASAGTSPQPVMSTTQSGKPQYVTSFKTGLTLPLTARVSNDRFDVVHFRLSVIVSAKAVPQFLQELCSGKEHRFKGFRNELPKEETFKHNQITILKSDFEAVDPEDNNNRFYRYGPDGVVKLVLVCEYIFDKKGYDAVKPPSVRKDLESRIVKPAS